MTIRKVPQIKGPVIINFISRLWGGGVNNGFANQPLLQLDATVSIGPSLCSMSKSLRKRLRIRSVISVNYHYIIFFCPFNLLFCTV